MSRSKAPWRFPITEQDTGKTGPHALTGLPLEVAGLIGEDLTSGVNGYASHFNRWEGPTADAAAPGTGGWFAVSVDGLAGAAESIDVRDSATHGVLRIQTNAADNDNTNIFLNGTGFKYTVGKRLWFLARVAPQTANDGELFFGLAIEGATDPINTQPTDGLFFSKAETDTTMTFNVRKNATSTTKTALDTSAMANDTFHTYGFFVDEVGNISISYDGDEVATVASTDTNLPNDEDLTIILGVQTGSAATRYMDVDYVVAYQER